MKQYGVSLIELCLVLGILAVLTSWGLPNFNKMYHNARANAYISQQQQLLLYGRSLANQTNTPVSLCPSNDGHSCSNNWQDAQLLFSDPNANGLPDLSEQILLHSSILADGQQLRWQGFSSNQYLTLSPIGSGYYMNGTFRFYESPKAEFARSLILRRNGQNRLGLDTNHNGIMEDASNTDLVCPL